LPRKFQLFSFQRVSFFLLNILHLLADLFQFGFRLDHGLCDEWIVCFRAYGIEFPEKFLAEEIERASGGFLRVDVFVEFCEMGLEAGDFLGNIAAIREKGEFLGEALIFQFKRDAQV